MKHPSIRAYQNGCRCLECTEINRQTCQDYRDRRRVNGGPLIKPVGIPSTMTRLRREIGIVAEWRGGRWQNKLR